MKFQFLAERLIKLKWLTAHEPDDADLQYDEFTYSECSKHREQFATFGKSIDAVDQFLGEFLQKNQNYISFGRVYGIIFVICHGESAIERWFSVNKQLLVENVQEKSLVYQQIVK